MLFAVGTSRAGRRACDSRWLFLLNFLPPFPVPIIHAGQLPPVKDSQEAKAKAKAKAKADAHQAKCQRVAEERNAVQQVKIVGVSRASPS